MGKVKIVRSNEASQARPEATRAELRVVASHGVTSLLARGRGVPSWQGRAMENEEERFAAIYETWFFEVVRWIGVLGMPASEAEDLAQEVFLVVGRKLSTFDGGNEAGWLYRITELTVRDHRRRAWFKNLFVRRQREVDLERLTHTGEGPALAYEHQEDRLALQRILLKINKKRRTTFILFEIEGCSGEEIAAIQDIPLGTVWTRLHHARKEFWKLVAELRRQSGEARGEAKGEMKGTIK